MIISVANLKGGLMRSTSAALLAEAYSRMGKNVAIADTSWDGGAAHWLKLAHQNGNVSPIEVHELPIDAMLQAHQIAELGDELRANIQQIEESLGDDAVVIVDTNARQEQELRELDSIVDCVAVPFDGSSMSVEPTRRTLLAINAPTIMFGCGPRADEPMYQEMLNKVGVKATREASTVIGYSEEYQLCRIPDDMTDYEALASELIQ